MVSSITSGADFNPATETANGYNFASFDFDMTDDESVWFIQTMPDNWDGGDIALKLYWTADIGAGAATVDWQFGAMFRANTNSIDGGALPALVGLVTGVAPGSLGTGIDTTNFITPEGDLSIDSLGFFLIRRDADILNAGQLAEDAKLIGVEVLYTPIA